MRLAIPFKRHYKLNDEADEFNICYDPKLQDFNDLLTFAQTYEDKTINIRYRNSLDTKTAVSLGKICDNVQFVVNMGDINSLEKLRENDIPYYFSEEYPCRSFKDLQSYIESLGVSSVYIADDLCYELPAVRRYCGPAVRIRVVLNKVPITITSPSDPTIMVWIPQDKQWMDQYFDVAEFDCGKDKGYNYHQLEVLHRSWFERQDWAGDMREICKGIPYRYVARTILPGANQGKIKCGLGCVRHGWSCTKCKQILELSEHLVQKKFQFSDVGTIRQTEGEDLDNS